MNKEYTKRLIQKAEETKDRKYNNKQYGRIIFSFS